MADEELVEVARAAADAYLDANLDRAVNWSFDGDEFADTVREAVLKRLAERGRLVPDGAEVGEQWEARCHGDDSDGIRLHSQYAEPSREQAEEWAREQIGRYGITRYTVRRREVRRWPDGSSWTGPWVAVDEETTGEEPT